MKGSSLLLIFALVGVAIAAPFIDSLNENVPVVIDARADEVDYRLTDEVLPSKYIVKLEPLMDESDGVARFSFKGTVDIYLKTDLENIKEIVLHSVGLDIDHSKTTLSQTLAENNKIVVDTPIPDDVTQKLTFPLKTALRNFIEYKLSLTFTGKLSSEEDMHGFYRSSYTQDGETLYIATTQFETTHARKAFPCFDEPKFKAIFEITLVAPEGYSAVSNMNIATTTPVGTKQQHTFKPTPILSTYLVAFIVSKLQVNQNAAKDFGVWSRRDALSQTDYSVDVGPKLLGALNTWFDFDYYTEMGMEKMEMAALPDFSAGAMENLGLLTYRETALLYDASDSTDIAKQRVASVITHEQAHMWFGDLVTCEWWSYTWLNEGFARYFQYFGTAVVEDKWNLGEQFVIEQLQGVMVMDSQLSTHAMTVDVQSHSELSRAFDSISYNKGASVIRMMEHMIGTATFTTALQKYLKANKFSTTNPTKLFTAIQAEVTGIEIGEVLLPWTEQPGYPVINVEVAADRQSAKVTQKRFLLSGETDDTKWTIPLTYVNSGEDFTVTVPKHYFKATDASADIAALNAADKWTIFNVQQTGYYRVMYDPTSWDLISSGLKAKDHDGIHLLNRAQILDDIFNFGRSGSMKYERVLEIVSYLTEEENYLPWLAAFNNFVVIERRLDEENLAIFKNYILALIGKIYNKVGFVAADTETQLDIYNRAQILSWACKYGNADCIENAKSRYLPLLEANSKVPVNIRAAVYCTAIREGGAAEWNILWNKFTTENVAAEQVLILSSLGCSKDETVIKGYLDNIFTENSFVRSQDRGAAVSATYTQNRENVDFVYNYVVSNKEALAEIYGSKGSVASLLATLAERFTTTAQITKLKSYITESKEYWGTSVTTLERGVTSAESNMAWTLLNIPSIIDFIKSNDDPNSYRLGDTVKPIRYDVKLEPFLETTDGAKRFAFEGTVDIYLKTDQANVLEITLHSVGLEIDHTKTTLTEALTPANVIQVGVPVPYTETQKLVFPLTQILTKDVEYELSLTFTGELSSEDDMHGFYRSSYTQDGKTLYLATTQFQTTHARRAFPCFDEPKFKAIFEITLTAPEGFTAISNMKVDTKTPVVDSTKTQYKFKPTPILSSYLVAFIISQLEVNANESGNFGVWSRKDALSQTDYSVDVGPKLLNALNNWMDFDYYKDMTMEKMEMAALPDFSAGAMENLGLLTYRETALLYDANDSTDMAQQRVATVITHEQAHMWFGDLVTCEWWKYTWLNEGFATYFQYYATAIVETTWDLPGQFVVDQLQAVMVQDSLLSTHPITVDVEKHTEISKAFDSISYNKGGSVIRMMEHMVGSDKFKLALQTYLKQNQFSTSTPDILFAAIQVQADASINVAETMLPWTEQSGYPVVNVVVSPDRSSAVVSQKRYLLSGETDTTKWTIPLTYAKLGEANAFTNTKPKVYLKSTDASLSITELDAADKWVIFNVQQTGYYRVNYDEDSWNLIKTGLREENQDGIHYLNRAQIVDDSLNFGRSGDMSYDKVFDILTYLTNEENYLPWLSAFKGFSFLETRMDATNLPVFKKHILYLIENIYNKLGFEKATGDTRLDVYNRAQILSWACKYGNEDCIDQAKKHFEAYQAETDPKPVPVNIRSAVYCTAIREGGSDEWNTLWTKFTTENVAAEQVLILSSLGCSKDETIIKGYLDKIFVANSNVRAQDRAAAVSSTYTQNPENINFVYNYIVDKKEAMATIYGNKEAVASLLSAVAGRFTSEEEITKLKAYLTSTTTYWETSAVETIQKAIKSAEENLEWSEKYISGIVDFVNDFHDSSMKTTLSLSLVAIAASLVLFFR